MILPVAKAYSVASALGSKSSASFWQARSFTAGVGHGGAVLELVEILKHA